MPACVARVTVEPMVTTLMLSTPAATTRSWVPDRTPCTAKWTACWDDPHCRSMVTPGTLSGRPADSQAFLAMSKVCGPICETQPMITSSTAAGSTPVRSISPRRARGAYRTGYVRLRHCGLRLQVGRVRLCLAGPIRRFCLATSRYLVSRPAAECRSLEAGRKTAGSGGGYDRTHLAVVSRRTRRVRMDPRARQDEARCLGQTLSRGNYYLRSHRSHAVRRAQRPLKHPGDGQGRPPSVSFTASRHLEPCRFAFRSRPGTPPGR